MSNDKMNDPFAAWQKFMSESEDQLNKTMNQYMSMPQYGETANVFMKAMAKYQQTVSEAGRKYLTSVNLPSRDDIVSVGEQLRVIDDRLTRIEHLLANADLQSAPPTEEVPRPKRTRKPAKPAS